MMRAADKWLPGLLAAGFRRPRPAGGGPRHLFFAVADHFEPHGRGTSPADARAMVARWVADYPRRFDAFRDAEGRPPRHTFFYPAEEYDEQTVAGLAPLCRDGWAEVELHLHHRGDTAATLAAALAAFRDQLRTRHGLLGTDREGRVRYGFVHGNWALCNSRPDGDWCGVNTELAVLRATGCYADFTFPSAPSSTQPRTVNAIYYAADRPDGGPRGHDRGISARVGGTAGGEDPARLLLIQGPLALNWRRRKWGCLPRLENAELSGANPPDPARLALWTGAGVHVRGRPDWIFVKLHTHGAVPANADALLGEPMLALHRALAAHYNDGRHWRLHYVSAREMANAVWAAEAGMDDPAAARDHVIAPPPCRGA